MLCPGIVWVLYLGVGIVFSSSRLVNMLSSLLHGDLVWNIITWPCLRGIFTSFSCEEDFLREAAKGNEML